MLVALVSARETIAGEGDGLVGELFIAGRSIIERQVSFALDRGAKRIICLAERPRSALVQLQHLAESAGASFILATDRIALANALRADDRLLVITGGLVLAREATAFLDTERPVIFALPADPAVEHGFERIDRERAWAGIMVLRGALVERLNDLPEGMDCISSLLRLGLQSGIPVARLESYLLQAPHLGLAFSEGDAIAWGRAEIAHALEPARWYWPGQLVARQTAGRIAMCGIGQKRYPSALGIAAAVLVALAGGLAALGHALPALVATGTAAAVLLCAFDLATIHSRAIDGAKHYEKLRFAGLMAVDAAILAAVVVAMPGYAREDAAFAGFMLLGLLHLLPMIGVQYRVPFLSDRAVLALALAVSVGFGIFYNLLQIFAVATLIFGFIMLMRSRLTRA